MSNMSLIGVDEQTITFKEKKHVKITPSFSVFFLNFVNGYTMLKLPQYSVYFNKFSDGAKW